MEHQETCEFTLVSKWREKKEFKAWLARPEHRQQHQARKRAELDSGTPAPQLVLEKRNQHYEVID